MSSDFPTNNRHLVQSYGATSLEKKLCNKEALQRELGWPCESKRPMLCVPEGLTCGNGGTLFRELFPGLLSLSIEILIRGKGSKEFGALLTQCAKEECHRLWIVPDEEKYLQRMYAASDMALMFNGSPTKELQKALTFSAVPIAPEGELLSNYDPVQETGNAFTYEKMNPWHCFTALVRAVETYRLPFDWRTIQRECMKSV